MTEVIKHSKINYEIAFESLHDSITNDIFNCLIMCMTLEYNYETEIICILCLLCHICIQTAIMGQCSSMRCN